MNDEGSDADGGIGVDFDAYQGTWHRPARFNDGHDADKEYYGYDNRVSYEYRKSIDHSSARSFWKIGGGLPSLGSAGSLGGLVAGGGGDGGGGAAPRKGLIRRSIDKVRLSIASDAGWRAGSLRDGRSPSGRSSTTAAAL
eukprot:286277-Chlamydomonas_euryale.AAC.1